MKAASNRRAGFTLVEAGIAMMVSVVGMIAVAGAFAIAVKTNANSQNMTTTAEGIETEPQRDVLRDLGCTEMQGFLFSRPRPVTEIRALLAPATGRVAAA